MRTSILLCLLVAGCGSGGSGDAGGLRSDGGARRDAAALDDAGLDAGPGPSDAGGAGGDAGPDAAPTEPEDCSTSLDEDGNGYAGCDDPTCWAEAACRDAELAEVGLAGWTACGDPTDLDEAATSARCEAGTPFPTMRDFSCGRVPTTVRLQAYCEPAGGSGRALRYEVAMDVRSESEMLGPMASRNTSFSPELGYLGGLYVATAGGGSSSEDPVPLTDAFTTDRYRAVAWVTGRTAGDVVTVFLGASSQTSTIYIRDDGSVDATHEDPVFFLTAAFEAPL